MKKYTRRCAMKTDKNGCSTTADEHYEEFKVEGKSYIQYDYRTQCGVLFSCIAQDVEGARRKRDTWLKVTGEI